MEIFESGATKTANRLTAAATQSAQILRYLPQIADGDGMLNESRAHMDMVRSVAKDNCCRIFSASTCCSHSNGNRLPATCVAKLPFWATFCNRQSPIERFASSVNIFKSSADSK